MIRVCERTMTGDGIDVGVDRSRRILRIVLTGPLTEALMTQASRLMRSSPEFQSGFGVLIDLFGLTSIEIPAGIVQTLAEAAQRDKNRMAILVNPTQMAVYGLARLYEILSDLSEDRVRVFQNEASVIDWLIPD